MKRLLGDTLEALVTAAVWGLGILAIVLLCLGSGGKP
jgi:hypothetical protein